MITILDDLISRYPSLNVCRSDILEAYRILEKVFENAGKLLTCGNGGSAADADHIAGELMKGFLLKRKIKTDSEVISHLQDGLPVISLSAHSALITAFMNDCDPEYVYAQQVYAYSKNGGDALIALSTSGNSKNVVNAVETANYVGTESIAITGKNESKLSEISTVCIRLPETETYKIQELTIPVYHCLCAMIEKRFFG